jgi:hypothetical protein
MQGGRHGPFPSVAQCNAFHVAIAEVRSPLPIPPIAPPAELGTPGREHFPDLHAVIPADGLLDLSYATDDLEQDVGGFHALSSDRNFLA